jgi:hypothetical protein
MTDCTFCSFSVILVVATISSLHQILNYFYRSPTGGMWALKPHATNLNYFYVWSDVLLFCLATAIVMGFWGEKTNRAWIVNAFAVVCFYISDMWFAYAAVHVENYQSGFFLEIFWTFGAILFGVAAANEFDLMLVRRENRQDADLDTPTSFL